MVLSIATTIFATAKLKQEMLFNTFTLPNGLRIIHASSPTQVVYCGYAINAGTRDEADNEQGLAHFVEHLIFKGTTKRRAWHILNRMEHVGGDLNAYTNKEETVIYATSLAEHFGRALELMTDIVFHSVFPPHEIEKEVEVILDEIQSYEDTPSELIFDDFEELAFKGHPLGRNILGNPETLRTFGTEDALRWVGKYYHPDNMVFFVFGNIPFNTIVRKVREATEDVPAVTTLKPQSTLPDYEPTRKQFDKDTHQAHVMIGTRSYPANDERRTGLYLLNNLLGGPGMNSRLNVSLRERKGLVYTVESNLISYTDTGTFSIYFGCDPADVDKCLHLVRKELDLLREKPLTPSQLKAAQKQLIGQIAVASDNFENIALEMGKTYLHYDKYESQEAVFQRIEALRPELLQQIANELFTDEQMTTLLYLHA